MLEDVSVSGVGAAGIQFLDSERNQIANVSVVGPASEGLVFSGSGTNWLTNVSVVDNGLGTAVTLGGDNSLERVSVVNAAAEGFVFTDDDNVLVDVSVDGSRAEAFTFLTGINLLSNVSVTGNGAGDAVSFGGGKNDLSNVSVSDSPSAGLRFDGSDNILRNVTGGEFRFVGGENTLVDVVSLNSSGNGFQFDGGGNTLERVTVTDSQSAGLSFGGGSNDLRDVSVVTSGDEGISLNGGDSRLRNVSVADSGGVGIYLEGVNDTLDDITVISNTLAGIRLSDTSGTVLRNVTATDNEVGMLAGGTTAVLIDGVVTKSNAEGGIWLSENADTTIRNARVVENRDFGLLVVKSAGLTIEELTVKQSGGGGAYLGQSSDVWLRGVEADRNGQGIVMWEGRNIVIYDAVITDSRYRGIEVDSDATDVAVKNATVLRSGAYDVLHGRGNNVTFDHLALTSATLSFEGRVAGVSGVDTPPADPTTPDLRNVGIHVEAIGVPDSRVNVTVAYDEADIKTARVDESTLGLWSYDDGMWWMVNDSRLDTAANTVSANLTGGRLGVLAILGEPLPPTPSPTPTQTPSPTPTQTPSPTPTQTPLPTPTATPGNGGEGGDESESSPDGTPTDVVELIDATLVAETVAIGSDAVVEVRLSNANATVGRAVLALTADGTAVTERTVMLPGSSEATVALAHRFERPGTYALAVNDVPAGTLTVTGAEMATPLPVEGMTPTAGPISPTATPLTPIATDAAGPGFGALAVLVTFGLVVLLARSRG
jgi:parallel beta-helix repeat protein